MVIQITRLHDCDHIVFPGGGVRYGRMLEGRLKLTEMAIIATQIFHPGQISPWPGQFDRQNPTVVMLYHGETAAADAAIVRDAQDMGAFVIGSAGPGDVSLPVPATGDAGGAEVLPALQIPGERPADSKRIDTTAHRHLRKVLDIA